MRDIEITGTIFNTQKFSIHDGAGIRSVVFFKGCPLQCQWCANPESQNFRPEHAFNPNRCLGATDCGRCLKICPSGALQLDNGMIRFDASQCVSCGQCASQCPGQAQILYGEKKSVGDIIRRVEEDDVFYQRSGGGITISGGEPMAQPRFALALLREARKARIHTMMETCGHCATRNLDAACRLLDGLIMDVKSIDSEKHKKFTGRGNELILDNLRHALKNFPDLPILVRTPVIPGFNDSMEEIMAIRGLLQNKPNTRYEVLTYHRLGMPKCAYLGKKWQMGDVGVDDAFMKKLREDLEQKAG